MKEIKKHGFRIQITQSDHDCNPRKDNDNVGTIAYNHSRYELGEEKISDPIDWLIDKLGITEESVERYANSNGYQFYSNEVKEFLEDKFLTEFIGHKLYLYDHSGITISTSPFGCRWDSGQVGYIYCTKERVVKEWGNKICTKEVKEQALKYLQSEIDEFDAYIRGEVYDFQVDLYGEIIDSCVGFIGSDHEKSGILDYATECIPTFNEVREQGSLVSVKFEGNKIIKIFDCKVGPYPVRFRLVEDTVTKEVEHEALNIL
jgi:hypothetical protein